MFGFKPEQQVASSSSYMVPSQEQYSSDGNEVVDLTTSDKEAEGGHCRRKGLGSYHDFMPKYQSLCKFSDGTGESGDLCWKIFKKKLNEATSEMMAIHEQPASLLGIVSHPEITKKKLRNVLKNQEAPTSQERRDADNPHSHNKSEWMAVNF